MIDLVITHLTHPWGPPGTLETLGDPWRPCLKMVILAILTIFRHGRQGFPRSCTRSRESKWYFLWIFFLSLRTSNLEFLPLDNLCIKESGLVCLLLWQLFQLGLDRPQSQLDSYLRNCESHSQAGLASLPPFHSSLAEKYIMGEINEKRLLTLVGSKNAVYHPFLSMVHCMV